MRTAEYWIKHLELLPHKEGGFYREIYRSSGIIAASALPPEFGGARNYATSIYFLLRGREYSAFHRIRQDEIWHFYDGSEVILHCITDSGAYYTENLGLSSRTPQIIIPAGTWFAAELADTSVFALVGCGVAPGFDFQDFELPSTKKLTELFPQHSDIIRRLTR